MKLKSPHSDFRLDLVSPVDVRAVGLDQLLTHLWLRVLLDNARPAKRTLNPATIPDLAHEIRREANRHFRDFHRHPEATEAWLRADLVRPLRRDPVKYTVARPLHANAVRLRSGNRQAEDSNASLAVYSWLWNTDPRLLKQLRRLISDPVNEATEDLVTLALFHLGAEQEEDQPAKPKVGESFEPPAPLSERSAADYASDVRALLAYRGVMPRPALIGHLRRLTGFHVGMYLLRVFAIVAEVDRSGAVPEAEPRLELIVDFGEDSNSPVARLAAQSWERREQVLHEYVRAHLALKKLHQYSEHAVALRKTKMPTTLAELVALEKNAPRADLDSHFQTQLLDLFTKSKDDEDELKRLAEEYRDLGMSPFRIYAGVIANASATRWYGYHRELLDYLFSKNTSDGFLRQPLGGRSRRRAAMGADLLETLTVVALVKGKGTNVRTQAIRVDELIHQLERRYDLCIATPPEHLDSDLEAARILATNVERFKTRLRETGLFRDLSDAFVAQLVRPRFVIE